MLIIRHGQSTWNAARRWQGQADPPLSMLGERQAFEAAQRLGTFDAIICSDLQRAALTGQIIADQLAIGPVLGDERLRETFAGDWQGLTADEIHRDYPGYLEDHRRPDNFETAEHVVERVTACLTELAATFPGGEILVVSHGGVVRALTRLNGGSEVSVPNLGGGWFDVTAAGGVAIGDTVDLLGGWNADASSNRPADAASAGDVASRRSDPENDPDNDPDNDLENDPDNDQDAERV